MLRDTRSAQVLPDADQPQRQPSPDCLCRRLPHGLAVEILDPSNLSYDTALGSRGVIRAPAHLILLGWIRPARIQLRPDRVPVSSTATRGRAPTFDGFGTAVTLRCYLESYRMTTVASAHGCQSQFTAATQSASGACRTETAREHRL